MKEHIVALCYILLIAGVCFALMYKPMTARLVLQTDFRRRVGLWFAVTLIMFLAHNYWLALLACAVVIAVARRRESNPVALYAALLFAAPQFAMQIPGLGLVNQLFVIDYPRALALVILVPATVRLATQPRPANPRLLVPDLLFCAYFLYIFLAHATADSITGLMRFTVYVTLDHALLYYLVTRLVTDRRRFYDLIATLAMVVAVAAVVGVFESMRNWLVYESLRTPLGVPLPDIAAYLMRVTEDGAHLRAYTTMGHGIAFGYVCMLALVLQIALSGRYGTKLGAPAIAAMLAAGLLAALSRGPWLGCAVALAAGLSFGLGARKRLLRMITAVPVVAVALLVLPSGQKLIDMLPFVGTVEAGNVTYRSLLVDRALIVFWQNPIFGSLRFIDNPVLEEMRQGQGIIDIVNSYLGVALAYGGVGLALFLAPALWALGATLATRHALAQRDAAAEAAGRAVAAAALGNLLVIGTTSQIFHIPLMHWLLFGMGAAYTASASAWNNSLAALASPAVMRGRRPSGAPAPHGASRTAPTP
jgi:hypothetical protein